MVPISEPPSNSPKSALLDKVAMDMLLLAIKSLSQRALVAISQMFTLLSTASAFWLWHDVLPNPNTYQLIGLGFYGAFLLLLEIVRRRS